MKHVFAQFGLPYDKDAPNWRASRDARYIVVKAIPLRPNGWWVRYGLEDVAGETVHFRVEDGNIDIESDTAGTLATDRRRRGRANSRGTDS